MPDIHMTPAEGMRAHLDLQGGAPFGTMLPIRWATFNLAPHPWAEPGEGTIAAAEETGAAIALPRPGEPFEPMSRSLPTDPWWRPVAPQPVERRPVDAARITEVAEEPMGVGHSTRPLLHRGGVRPEAGLYGVRRARAHGGGSSSYRTYEDDSDNTASVRARRTADAR